MNDDHLNPLQGGLSWLTRHTCFPSCRVEGHALRLVLLSECAGFEERRGDRGRFSIQRRDGAKDAALRAHAMRRSLAHYKCDNSAKV